MRLNKFTLSLLLSTAVRENSCTSIEEQRILTALRNHFCGDDEKETFPQYENCRKDEKGQYDKSLLCRR